MISCTTGSSGHYPCIWWQNSIIRGAKGPQWGSPHQIPHLSSHNEGSSVCWWHSQCLPSIQSCHTSRYCHINLLGFLLAHLIICCLPSICWPSLEPTIDEVLFFSPSAYSIVGSTDISPLTFHIFIFFSRTTVPISMLPNLAQNILVYKELKELFKWRATHFPGRDNSEIAEIH